MHRNRFIIAAGLLMAAAPQLAAAGSLPPLKLKPTTAWFAPISSRSKLPSPDSRVPMGKLIKKNGRILRVGCGGTPTVCTARRRTLCTTENECSGTPVLSRVLFTRLYRDTIPWQILSSPECVGIVNSLDSVESAITDDATDGARGCDFLDAWTDYNQIVANLYATCSYEQAPGFWQSYLQQYCEMLAAQLACVAEPALIGTASTSVVQSELEDVWQYGYETCCSELDAGVASTGAQPLGCP